MTLTETRHTRQVTHKAMAAVMLMLLPLLWGCGMRSGVAFFDHPDEPEAGGATQYVTLDLRIGVDDGGSGAATRAFPDSEDNTFEEEATPYERVNTLRVVIVDADGSIEHNRMVNVKGEYAESGVINSYYIINDNLRFKVKAGEVKKIYLFANEKAVNMYKDESEQFDFVGSLAPGLQFPTAEVAGLLIVRPEGKPFIDNNPTSPTRTYIPMSECFDITVPPASGDAEDSYTETLFLTRSLIKFSFSMTLIDGDDNDVKYMHDLSGMKIRGVRISNLANTCYYLPKETTYNPAKGESSDYNLGGRYITAFDTPGITGTPGYPGSECDFLFSQPLELTLKGLETDSYVYLPETKTIDSYNLSLLFSDPDNYALYEAKPLLQVDGSHTTEIPRNTHVKINIYLSAHNMSATVTLFPYTAVDLKPTFGF